jgi:hypothetical protein
MGIKIKFKKFTRKCAVSILGPNVIKRENLNPFVENSAALKFVVILIQP